MAVKPFTLYKRKLNSGRVLYYAIFRDESGARLPAVSTGEAKKAAAESWAIKHLNAKKREKAATLADFTTDFFRWGVCPWIARQHAQGRPFSSVMARMRRGHLDRLIIPAFGKMRLGEIKAGRISDFLLKLELSNSSKNQIRNTISIVMEEAVFQELIEYNPVKNLRRFADNYQKRDIFAADELRRLFPEDRGALFDNWAGPYWSTFFFVMLTTGIRLGEIRALFWANVDFTIPALTVTRAVKSDRSIGPPKSREQRAVYLPPRTAAMLEMWRAASRYTAVNDLVFHGRDGQHPIHSHTALDYFRKGLKAAGIETRGRVLVIHSLRHQYNSIMRRAISESALQYMIGHTSTAMTDRYDGAGPLDKLRAFLPEREKIDDAWK
ncbi:MAG: site-specific integrase [Spirochaetales bacterium]|nr:site-specific integrase [Spirochaetales bacterium]